MKQKIPQKLVLGFMQIHILVQAKKEAFFGLWMIDELKNYGYTMSPGTIYPLLTKMENENLLKMEVRLVGGKNRKYYYITEEGMDVLLVAKEKAMFLFKELEDV